MKTTRFSLNPLLLLAGALAMALPSTRAVVPGGTPTFSNSLEITNAFSPFQVGGTKVFTGTDTGQRTVAVDLYLAGTRSFAFNGKTVECRILREINFERGELIESTDNYFAQADDGTVYYFGEVVDNYENGVIVDHHGSWLVGGRTLDSDPPAEEVGNETDPNVFMPATPEPGDKFKPEDLLPIVDETGEIIAIDKRVITPAARYKDAIIVRETSQLTPDVERKWYVSGVGVVKVRGKKELLLLSASTLVQVP
jgi:hypothetical protein